MKQILLIDNYDSFTFNLVDSFQQLGYAVDILQNDCDIEQAIQQVNSYHSQVILVISPGPGSPEDAGISIDLVRYSVGRFPVLGICLGHQVIAAAFGSKISQARQIRHGKQSRMIINEHPIFNGCESSLTVGRYHSLAVESPPHGFTVLATSEDDDTLMLMISESKQMLGIQFHPESILSNTGQALLNNCLNYLLQTESEVIDV